MSKSIFKSDKFKKIIRKVIKPLCLTSTLLFWMGLAVWLNDDMFSRAASAICVAVFVMAGMVDLQL